MDLGVLGIDAARLLERDQRLVDAPAAVVRHAEVRPHHRALGDGLGGLLVGGRLIADKPPVRRVCAVLSATVAIVVVFAAPLRGLADVTDDVARVRAVEERCLVVVRELRETGDARLGRKDAPV